MNDLALLVPELILFVGALLVFSIDVAFAKDEESGLSHAVLTVLFLLAALIAVILLQLHVEPQVAFSLLRIDAFAAFIKITVYTGMILIAIASHSYMSERTRNRGEFWTFFLMVSVAMSILAGASNLLLIYVTIEFLSITSYMLAGFLREEDRSNEAGLKYFLYGSVASGVMLYGISLLYGATGSLDLEGIAQALATNAETMGIVVLPATLLALAGLAFKASLAPFYQWAPDTYDGSPTPVATYLSTASKAAAFAVLVRVFVVALGPFQVDWVPVLAGLSILTMTMGNLAALRQSNVKRLMAYSSVAQAGYILMGLAAVASTAESGIDGVNGVLIYLFAYLFTNVGAFLSVMAIEERVGSLDISAYYGLIRRAPGLAAMFTLFLISLAGIPATGGFLGKFFVFGAAIQHQYYWLAAAGLVNAAIAAFYYLRVVQAMFFRKAETGEIALEVPIPMQISLTICALATLWIGLYPSAVLDIANTASQQLFAVMF